VGALPGAAADARRLSRFPQADGCSALRGLRHRVKRIGAGDPSNGAGDSFAVKVRRLGGRGKVAAVPAGQI
jgi:hypothetical protein